MGIHELQVVPGRAAQLVVRQSGDAGDGNGEPAQAGEAAAGEQPVRMGNEG